MRLRGLAFFVLGGVSAGLACAGDSGGGSGSGSEATPSPSASVSPSGSPTPTGLGGGFVSLFRARSAPGSSAPDLRVGYAEFPVPRPTVALVSPGVDACVFITPTPAPSPTPTPIRDAGPYLYLEGPVSVTLVNPFSLDIYGDQPDPEAFADGATYDVSWDGSAESNGIPAAAFQAALVFPSEVAVSSPNLDLTTHLAGALAVTWIADVDALDALRLTVDFNDTMGADVAKILCTPTDDGSFTIPQSYVDQMPNGVGTLVLERRRTSSQPMFDGSTIQFDGVSQHVGDAAKP